MWCDFMSLDLCDVILYVRICGFMSRIYVTWFYVSGYMWCDSCDMISVMQFYVLVSEFMWWYLISEFMSFYVPCFMRRIFMFQDLYDVILEMSDTLRKVERLEEWRELVAKTPVPSLWSITWNSWRWILHIDSKSLCICICLNWYYDLPKWYDVILCCRIYVMFVRFYVSALMWSNFVCQDWCDVILCIIVYVMWV